MKLLGIGIINAFALIAIIGDVRRFETPAKLVAYIGLNPGQRESGRGKNIKLGIGKRGRGDMRRLLVQGAHAVLRMGKALRAELSLPGNLDACILHLPHQILSHAKIDTA